jgi:GTP pyrophosphokinase
VPLRTEIQNGDMIEILTTSNSNPSRDWLNYVVTSKARNRIRHFISEQQRSESIEMGRKLLEKEADRFQIKVKKMFQDTDGDLKRIANEYGLGRIDDLLASIGYGKIIPRNIIQKYLGSEKFAELDPDGKKDTVFQTGVKAVKKFVGMGDDSIIVSGVGNMMITRGRCCNPLRGEPIIGYISLGKGIVVHNKQCKNVKQLMINKDRIVPVEWAGKEDNEAFAVRLQALTENRNGMIADITGSIADIKTGIRNAQAKVSNDGQGLIEVTVEVFDLRHLEKVINAVKKVSGVIDVERMDGLSDE